MSKDEGIRSKRIKKLMWKSPLKFTDEEKEKVKVIFQGKPSLPEAYNLKNKIDYWFKTSDETTAKKGLEEWFQLVKEADVEAIQLVVKTFKRLKI